MAEPNRPESAVEGAEQDDQPAEMPTTVCTICTHPQAAEIDAGLLGGTPLRTIAGTFGLSRSAVGRHRQNHLTVQTITEPEPSEQRRPLRIVDVHANLAALADRLEKVVELATRTRKAPAAVAAMRELRQTLEAIARIQADPSLRAAASIEAIKQELDEGMGQAISAVMDFTLLQFGLATSQSDHSEMSKAVSRVVSGCLNAIVTDGVRASFGPVDTSAAQAFTERQHLEAARRMDAEVERRVEAELRRREAQARPALEAREVRAIEGGAAWSA